MGKENSQKTEIILDIAIKLLLSITEMYLELFSGGIYFAGPGKLMTYFLHWGDRDSIYIIGFKCKYKVYASHLI